MARARNNRRKPPATDRRPKKRVSLLDSEGVTYVDYKDVNLLRRFMSERAKIRARRVTGNDAQQQRAVARAIRVAREMALLPYSVRQVTHRGKPKRERYDGGTLSAASTGGARTETGPGPERGGDGAIEPAPSDHEPSSPADGAATEDIATEETGAADAGAEDATAEDATAEETGAEDATAEVTDGVTAP